ncbi:hypothetical protein DID88_006889 [Monilinia fructigena]|uniref:Uncharacterized protein n=1 Tax=Monilinia fructigena TaxID=38457 RepID=A0A395IGW6_9HELO|nr:hypothetical protein DID88_006889 [Monilinia fructigena]
MSSLKDIMDVDVDPLESQAYRRKEAAQQQASRPSIDTLSQSPSPQLDDTKEKSLSGSPRQNSMGMEPMTDIMPVKYTPVTGRISRAKRVYQFIRATTVGRLLLERSTSGDTSSVMENLPIHAYSKTAIEHFTQSRKNSAAAATSNANGGNFQPVNYSLGGARNGPVSQNQLTGAAVYTAASPGSVSSRTPSIYGEMTSTFNVRPIPEFSDHDPYRTTSSSFQGLYPEEASSFPGCSAPLALPLLRIPEETYMPGLSYTQENSPWCSSASDSTYSTQSDSSRTGRIAHRARSGSLVTTTEWSFQFRARSGLMA